MLATLPRKTAGDRYLTISNSVRTAAILTGLQLHSYNCRRVGNGLRFRLSLSDHKDFIPDPNYISEKRAGKPIKRYLRLNHKLTRSVGAVCWHGHRDFMTKLFEMLPTLRLQTGLATYRGKDDFLTKFPETGDKNIGSNYEPCSYFDACYCCE